MNDQKKYWIKIFIKKCTYLDNTQEQLDLCFKWCGKTYDISEKHLLELKEKYTVDEYLDRLIYVVDKHFTLKDLKEVIKFYSTDVGKKLLDYVFLRDIGEVGMLMNQEIEQDFSKYNKKNLDTRSSK